MRSRRSTTIVLASLLALSVAVPASAARSEKLEDIRMRDDCDPETFNAVLGDGVCVGDGDTTFDEFVQDLIEDGESRKWRNKPENERIREGDDLLVVNQGGEFHTLTPVAEFGGGCVDEVNELVGALTPVPECADPDVFTETGVAPGQSFRIDDLPTGRHAMMCLIHPWMQTTVTVRAS